MEIEFKKDVAIAQAKACWVYLQFGSLGIFLSNGASKKRNYPLFRFEWFRPYIKWNFVPRIRIGLLRILR